MFEILEMNPIPVHVKIDSYESFAINEILYVVFYYIFECFCPQR